MSIGTHIGIGIKSIHLVIIMMMRRRTGIMMKIPTKRNMMRNTRTKTWQEMIMKKTSMMKNTMITMRTNT